MGGPSKEGTQRQECEPLKKSRKANMSLGGKTPLLHAEDEGRDLGGKGQKKRVTLKKGVKRQKKHGKLGMVARA